MTKSLIISLAILYFIVLIIIWSVCVYSMVKIVKNRKQHIHLWLDTFFNPFNLVFMSSKLNEQGIKHQKRLFIFAIIFAVLISLSLFMVEIVNKQV